MFKIQGYDQFMTTIGKLNFFRWALESNILEYIEAHEEEIRTGYNTYLKDTMSASKAQKDTSSDESDTASSSQSSSAASTPSSTASSSSVESRDMRTTRRRTKQMPSSLTKLQVYKTPIELSFD
jgi:predicted extracellular nuclease